VSAVDGGTRVQPVGLGVEIELEGLRARSELRGQANNLLYRKEGRKGRKQVTISSKYTWDDV